MQALPYQTEPFKLNVPAYSAGQPFTIRCDTLPEFLHGGINHLMHVDVHVAITPTLSSGALTPLEAQAIVQSLTFDDGFGLQRINAVSGPVLRYLESAYNGGVLVTPDPDDAATTERMDFVRRVYLFGLPCEEGYAHDALCPTAALKAATFSGTWATLTQLDANCTAADVAVEFHAQCVPKYGEIIIPAALVQRTFAPGATDFQVPGVGLHAFLGIANSLSMDAITAGDFGNVTITGSDGVVVNSIADYRLARSYQADFANGHLRAFRGSPAATTDDASKVINSGTPTAVTPAPAVLNPLLWPAALRSKIRAVSSGSLLVNWTGTQATAGLLNAMYLAQAEAAQARIAAASLQFLKLRQLSKGDVKTLSKREYRGDRMPYLPYRIKVG